MVEFPRAVGRKMPQNESVYPLSATILHHKANEKQTSAFPMIYLSISVRVFQYIV